MNCKSCPYYTSGIEFNACTLTMSEYFSTQTNCTLVNDDGTINYQDEYFHDNSELLGSEVKE